MKKVYQEIICSEKGDCERAAIASLMGVELKEIPYWINDKTYNKKKQEWLKNKQLGFIQCYNHPEKGLPFKLTTVDGVECIASVQSQIFKNRSHAIVAKFETQESGVVHLKPIHDPNPKNKQYPNNIIKIATSVTFIVQKIQQSINFRENNKHQQEEQDNNDRRI